MNLCNSNVWQSVATCVRQVEMGSRMIRRQLNIFIHEVSEEVRTATESRRMKYLTKRDILFWRMRPTFVYGRNIWEIDVVHLSVLPRVFPGMHGRVKTLVEFSQRQGKEFSAESAKRYPLSVYVHLRRCAAWRGRRPVQVRMASLLRRVGKLKDKSWRQ